MPGILLLPPAEIAGNHRQSVDSEGGDYWGGSLRRSLSPPQKRHQLVVRRQRNREQGQVPQRLGRKKKRRDKWEGGRGREGYSWHAWSWSYDHRPLHPNNVGTEHVGFSPERK